MEPPALVILERAEQAARERRLAAGVEAERLIVAARAEAARIEEAAEGAAAKAAEAARRAVAAAADREIAALEAGAWAAIRPSPEAGAAAVAFVVAALLGEDLPDDAGGGVTGRGGEG